MDQKGSFCTVTIRHGMRLRLTGHYDIGPIAKQELSSITFKMFTRCMRKAVDVYFIGPLFSVLILALRAAQQVS